MVGNIFIYLLAAFMTCGAAMQLTHGLLKDSPRQHSSDVGGILIILCVLSVMGLAACIGLFIGPMHGSGDTVEWTIEKLFLLLIVPAWIGVRLGIGRKPIDNKES